MCNYFYSQDYFFKQEVEPTMVDPDSNEFVIDFEKVKISTLEELQKFVNKCLNETSANPPKIDIGNEDIPNMFWRYDRKKTITQTNSKFI